MSAKKPKADVLYDSKEDILFVSPKKKEYDSSYQIGNLIFDLNKKKKVIGVEILDASSVLGISRYWLNSIQSGELQIQVMQETINLRLTLKCRVRNSLVPSTAVIEKIRPEFFENSSMDLALASA